jgi:hypothetical protein
VTTSDRAKQVRGQEDEDRVLLRDRLGPEAEDAAGLRLVPDRTGRCPWSSSPTSRRASRRSGSTTPMRVRAVRSVGLRDHVLPGLPGEGRLGWPPSSRRSPRRSTAATVEPARLLRGHPARSREVHGQGLHGPVHARAGQPVLWRPRTPSASARWPSRSSPASMSRTAGQFDDVIYPHLARARMAMLGLQATNQTVRAPLAVPHRRAEDLLRRQRHPAHELPGEDPARGDGHPHRGLPAGADAGRRGPCAGRARRPAPRAMSRRASSPGRASTP